ncbi:siderophore-interacting protein [Actinoplanes palleronii]|uniref:Siderophore-interacting protein n=1 Tax=Actinoplanes palleronii TaxID=113570 RepID=A0ABQ4B155_9ACTN|nr:siderophore-interacting protein [Actinoplanes palleronii]GIE64211.1 siderophore-interacting protein [Actinoplanes palleronii]
MLEVTGQRRVSPTVVRVTLGGDGLERFTPLGFDQWFRLFLPREGQETLRLPTRTSSLWYAQYLATPKAKRPWVRNYTVRAFADGRLDVDFVIHTDADGRCGPATAFALNAKPGDQVGLLDQGTSYHPRSGNPRTEPDWTLLVADETGLPAVAGICGSLPADARGLAIVEIPVAADAQEFAVPAGVTVRWVARDEAGAEHAVPGGLALSALRDSTLPDGAGYAYLVGESALATGARRFLIEERGFTKHQVDFVGYWRHGHGYV